MADGDIKVVIEPAVVPGEDTAGTPTTVKQADGSVVVKQPEGDPLKALQRQHDELLAKDKAREEAAAQERIAAEEARRRAIQAEQELEATRQQSADNDFNNVATGLEAAEQAFNSAKIAYRAAFESGDPERLIEAQVTLNDTQSSVNFLRASKAEMETRKAEQAKRPAAPKPTGDPVEDFISRQSPRSAAWLRQRKHMIVDPAKSNLLTAAHYNALAKGLKGDSDEYFSHIEEYIGEKTAAHLSPPPPPPSPGNRQPPVAPVINAGGPGGVQGGGVEVRLTPQEATAAQDGTHVWNYDDPSGQKRFRKGDPIGVEEFARRKKAMKDQGLYDRVYLEQ